MTDCFETGGAYPAGWRDGPAPWPILIGCSGHSFDVPVGRFHARVMRLRTPGNSVPPPDEGSFACTLRYALGVLGVRDIVVCGHTACTELGGPRGAPPPPGTPFMSRVAGNLAARARRTSRTKQHALAQLDRLRERPAVARAERKGRLRLHAWIYLSESGLVLAHDPRAGAFVPLAEQFADAPEGWK